MKRFLTVLAIVAVAIAANITLETNVPDADAQPGERYSRACFIDGGVTSTKLVIPTCWGAGFRPEYGEIWTKATALQPCSLTVYKPAHAGPATATDSTWVVVRMLNVNANLVFRFYGPFSDTMRVKPHAGSTSFCYLYFWAR